MDFDHSEQVLYSPPTHKQGIYIYLRGDSKHTKAPSLPQACKMHQWILSIPGVWTQAQRHIPKMAKKRISHSKHGKRPLESASITYQENYLEVHRLYKMLSSVVQIA
jgi:hypothetical protein